MTHYEIFFKIGLEFEKNIYLEVAVYKNFVFIVI